MKTCRLCGQDNNAWASFCRFCGNALEKELPDTQPLAIPVQEKTDAPTIQEVVVPADPLNFETIIGDSLQPVVDLGSETLPSSGEDELLPLEQSNDPNRTRKLVYLTEDSELPVEHPTTDIEPSNEFPVADSGELLETHTPSVESTETELGVGSVLFDRYRIIDGVEESEGLQVFIADDLRQCWSCDAEQAQIGDDFCRDCGAELVQFHQVRLIVRHVADNDSIRGNSGEWLSVGEMLLQVEPLVGSDEVSQSISGMCYAVGYSSHSGQERDIDEDSILVLQLAAVSEAIHAPVLGIYAIADGMGGHEAGEVASRVAVYNLASGMMEQVFAPELRGAKASTEELCLIFQKLVLGANRAILELRHQLDDPDTQMGCTLTAVLLNGASAIVANVGDSRTYHMRAGKLTQITRDHSVVARMVEQNLLAPEQIYLHEKKGMVYRSLGDQPDVEVDTFILNLELGDQLLLCSDGLWEMVKDPLIEEVLLQQFVPQSAAERLVELANLAGGDDNISVIVLDLCAFS